MPFADKFDGFAPLMPASMSYAAALRETLDTLAAAAGEATSVGDFDLARQLIEMMTEVDKRGANLLSTASSPVGAELSVSDVKPGPDPDGPRTIS